MPEAHKKPLGRLLANSKDLLALINDIPDLSKLNAGMMHGLANEKGLALTVESKS